MGSAIMGSLQLFLCFSTEGLFWYSREPTFIFPRVLGRTFFPNLSKLITFAAAPLALTPFVRNHRLDVVPRDFGYLCRVKDLADVRPESFVSQGLDIRMRCFFARTRLRESPHSLVMLLTHVAVSAILRKSCATTSHPQGEQIELVVLFEEGSPDAFLQGNMITDPGQHKPTPQKLRVMNGVPISFETKTQRSKFSEANKGALTLRIIP